MIHLGEKLRFAQEWYEIALLKEEAIKNQSYEAAAATRDKERALLTKDEQVFFQVKDDMQFLKVNTQIEHKNLVAELDALILYYQQSRNDRLNQILGNY